MNEKLIDLLITFALGASPILEMRGAIPFGLGILNLTYPEAVGAALLGNMTAIALLLKFLDPLIKRLMAISKPVKKYLTKLLRKTRHEHSLKFKEFGALFLITFVAIPFPMTGAWTAALISYLFGVRFWPALILIGIGNLGSAFLVSAGFSSINGLAKLL